MYCLGFTTTIRGHIVKIRSIHTVPKRDPNDLNISDRLQYLLISTQKLTRSSPFKAMKSIVVKWSGKEYPVELPEEQKVADLKRVLQEHTRVEPKRQKLIGLKTKDGKAATDEAALSDLAIKPNTKVMMMGQPEEVIAKADAEQLAAPEVQVSSAVQCPNCCSTMFGAAAALSSTQRLTSMRSRCLGSCYF